MQRFIAKNLVAISVACAALLALALGMMLAWQSYAAHQSARQLNAVQESAARLFDTATLLARERGFSAAVASSPDRLAGVGDVTALRAEVDRAWLATDTALNHTRVVASGASGQPVDVARLASARQQLTQSRAALDTALRQDGPESTRAAQQWFQDVTAVIAILADQRGQLLSSVAIPSRYAWVNVSLQNALWMASEMSGQLRGSLAAYAASGEPMPEEQRFHLHANRELLHRALADLTRVAQVPEADPRLRDDLERAVTTLADFDADVTRMLARATSGDYPEEAFGWFRQASVAVDEVIAVSRTLDEVVRDRFREDADRRRVVMVGFLLFAPFAGMLALLSLQRVRKNADALFHQQELAETTLRSIGDAVFSTDCEGRMDYMNPVAEELTGWALADARGRPSREVFRLHNTLHASVADPVGTCLSEGQVVHLASGHVLIRRDGTHIAIEDSAAPIRNREAEIVGCVVVFYDAGSQQRSEHLLAYHSTHDPQTDLINRREFDRRLVELIGRARELDEQHVMAYIDFDRFKVVNDTCGHSVGDRLLRQAAFLLRKSVRDTDVLARLGGDEFGLLLYNCDMEQALPILQKMSDTIRSFGFAAEGHTFDITVSIGAVAIDAHSATASSLMSEADAACYAAKENGRNRIQVYRADDTELSRRRGETLWVAEIGDALKENRFELFCQRIAPLVQPGRCNRLEVLVRLRTRHGELVPPMAFIPAAERYNLMAEVDLWVIRHACELIAAQPDLPPDLVFHLNLSGQTLSDPGLPEYLRTVARETGVAPQRLCFEVTETAAVASLHVAHDLMKTLREEGYTFALDDFGTGLSSFAYLRSLAVDHIKIDGTFVRNMLDDDLDQAMIRSVVAIARVLGITVCAEFAETEVALAKLRRMGVDYAQGHAVGYPLALRDYFAALLSGREDGAARAGPPGA